MTKTPNIHQLPWKGPRATAKSPETHFYTIGEFLRFVAKAVIDDGRTYAAIAREAEVCNSTVSKLAHGATRLPRADTMIKILAALGYKLVARS